MDYTDKYTNKQLETLEREIKREYGKAKKEVSEKVKKYFEDFHDRAKKEYEAYQNGAYTDRQWQDWLSNQIARDQRWKDLQKEMASRYSQANQVAVDYINNRTPRIYAETSNYTAYAIGGKEMQTSFTLVNEQAVRNLVVNKQNSVSFRVNSINPKRDYEWNENKIRNALTQGILQGDGIPQMTDRFMQVMKQNRTAAIRNARTSVTSAQNAGRQDTFEKAKDMGIELEKEWISTPDDRTRESHLEMDGERVPVDEPFSNGLMYPGDASGDPSEVYNCRCTMRVIIPGINDGKEAEPNEEDYQEWLDEQENQISIVDIMQNSSIIKTEQAIETNLQYFAEKDIKNQSSNSLVRAIRKYENRITEHKEKIADPKAFYPEWDSYDVRYQEGLKRHWGKEIRNFQQSIDDRKDELKLRGDYDE